jgi:hypothetical protein
MHTPDTVPRPDFTMAFIGDMVACLRTRGGSMNIWGIPDWLEEEVIKRDKICVYCGIQLIEKMPPRGFRKGVATWEHSINDQSIVSRKNIARCCVACNSSKGTKKRSDWIKSRGIKEGNLTSHSRGVRQIMPRPLALTLIHETRGSTIHEIRES